MTIRPQRLGAPGDRDQQRRLGGFQSLGRHAEPGQRPGTNAFQIAAERGQGQPDLQHAAAAVTRLQLQRPHQLDQLGAQGARPGMQQSRRLHRDCGAAGDDVAGPQQLGGGAQQGNRVDPGMQPEAPVFHRDQGIDQDRRDMVQIGAQPPHPVRRRQQGQRAIVPVQHLGPDGGEPGQVGREQTVQQDAGGGEQPQQRRDADEQPGGAAGRGCGACRIGRHHGTTRPAPRECCTARIRRGPRRIGSAQRRPPFGRPARRLPPWPVGRPDGAAHARRSVPASWPHSSGKGFDMVIPAGVSASGRIVCTAPKEPAKSDAAAPELRTVRHSNAAPSLGPRPAATPDRTGITRSPAP